MVLKVINSIALLCLIQIASSEYILFEKISFQKIGLLEKSNDLIKKHGKPQKIIKKSVKTDILGKSSEEINYELYSYRKSIFTIHNNKIYAISLANDLEFFDGDSISVGSRSEMICKKYPNSCKKFSVSGGQKQIFIPVQNENKDMIPVTFWYQIDTKTDKIISINVYIEFMESD